MSNISSKKSLYRFTTNNIRLSQRSFRMKNIFLSLIITCSLFSMTLEEKVGQIIMCPIHGNEMDQETLDFLKETKIGGVILYNWADNLADEGKLTSFISDLQKQSMQNTSQPLFVGIDQEGGRVQRIAMDLPSAEQMAKNGTDFVFDCGARAGLKLKSLGINLDFAPVVDVNSNPDNVVIRDRAFSDDPEIVIQSAEAFAKGLLSHGIMPCLKHYPGHGDVATDSHYGLPVSSKTLDELMKMELLPYKSLLPLAPFVMTAHILFPKIDDQNPATLSRTFLQDILRDKLGYRGLIICDSLRMEGILSSPLPSVAIEAFNAGNDILLIGGNRLIETDAGAKQLNLDEIKYLKDSLICAVLNNQISMSRLDESVERILTAKAQLLTK